MQMPNNVNYAENWQSELLEVMTQNALCGPFVTDNVRWLDAKTFHFTQMSVSGYKNHSRDGGWNRGNVTQTDHAYVVTHDRDVEFLIDRADVDESNSAASVMNISRTFEQTQAAPEADALFFSKVAAAAKKESGYNSSTAAADFTPETVFAKLKAMLAAGKLRRYRARGALIAYVSSAIMNALEQAPELTHTIELTRIADGGTGIETRITEIDGVPIMEVVDDEVFYDAFKFDGEEGGFALEEDEPFGLEHRFYDLGARNAGPLFLLGEQVIHPTQISTTVDYGVYLQFSARRGNSEVPLCAAMPRAVRIEGLDPRDVIGIHTYCRDDTLEVIDARYLTKVDTVKADTTKVDTKS